MLFRLVTATSTALHLHAIRWWREYSALIAVVVVIGVPAYIFFLAPPRAFPIDMFVHVDQGATLSNIATELAETGIIRSPLVFELFVRGIGGSRTIDAGTYRFDEPLSVISIARRLMRGDSGIPPVRVTFPEGLSVREMSEVAHDAVSQEFATAFFKEAKPYEGFLFPDTYLISTADTPAGLVAHMRQVFAAHTAMLEPGVQSSGRTLDEIIIMASLVEREANTDADRRIVAGILWDRLDLDMALQVDAVFGYILEKSAYAPTLEDLKINSPYNTYLYRGLPPTPIGNPGLGAIMAALEPTKTPYLYYLTGTDGTMYYARTFAEHQANRAKYLK